MICSNSIFLNVYKSTQIYKPVDIEEDHCASPPSLPDSPIPDHTIYVWLGTGAFSQQKGWAKIYPPFEQNRKKHWWTICNHEKNSAYEICKIGIVKKKYNVINQKYTYMDTFFLTFFLNKVNKECLRNKVVVWTFLSLL